MQSRFYHTTSCKFEECSTHRTAFVGKHNRAFNVSKKGRPNVEELRSLIEKLLDFQGDDFYLNEFPCGVDHRVYIDIDMPVPDGCLDAIKDSLEEIIIGDPQVQVLKNNVSGKVHIVMNVRATQIAGEHEHHATLRYLREYLYQAVESEISIEDWRKNFDCTAKGLRSAYSVKMDGVQVARRDFYEPVEQYPSKAQAILGTSMYLPVTGRWQPYVVAEIEKMNLVIWDEKLSRQVPSEYDEDRRTIAIDGVPMKVTQGLLDMLVSALPKHMCKGKFWRCVVSRVKHAGELCETMYSPAYLLGEWSAQSPAEYDAQANMTKYCSFGVDPARMGSYLTWLRNAALKGNRAAVLDFVHDTPLIYNRTNGVYFSQYLDVCRKYESAQEMLDVAGKFIRCTVGYIINGGNPFYVTKNLKDGQIVFEFSKNLRTLTDTITWVEEANGKKKVMKESFFGIVKALHREISFDRVDFIPYAPGEKYRPEGKIFNTFTGFKAKPTMSYDFTPIQPIISHIREVLAAGNDQLFEYLANWLAHIVQKPRVKLGTAIVFQASQGCGKNIFTDFLVSSIIGPRFSVTIDDVEQITGRFNVVMENKLLTVCDEMGNFGGCYKTNDKLKSLITQSEHNIERKGIDMVTVHDYNNYIMQSNNPWPVRVEAGDRRYVVIACSEERIGDFDYFKELAASQTPANADLFLTWLLDRDISEWNPRIIPDTELRRELKMRALDLPAQFLIHMLSPETQLYDFGPDHKLSSTALYGGFCQWSRDNQIAGNLTERSFSLSLNKIIKSKPVRIGGRQVKGYDMDRDAFIAALCRHLRMGAEELESLM